MITQAALLVALHISQTHAYAVRALLVLAQHPGEYLTAKQIADEEDLPSRYLAKVLQALARSGLVRSKRGPRGGFQLAVPRDEVTVLSIIRAAVAHRLGTSPRIVEDEVLDDLLQPEVERMTEEDERKLASVTLDELVRRSGEVEVPIDIAGARE